MRTTASEDRPDRPATNVPLAYATKANAAYAEVRRLIMSGALRPSERLNQEQLAVSLGMSTTPLREALRRLETEGLVVSSAHRDVMVAELDRDQLVHIFEARAALECFAASLAAERATLEEIAGMETALKELEEGPPGDESAARRAHRAIHESIYRSCHNPTVVEFLDVAWDRTERFRRFLSDLVLETTAEEYAAVVRAVADRRPDEAAAAMRRHLDGMRRIIEVEILNQESPTTVP